MKDGGPTITNPIAPNRLADPDPAFDLLSLRDWFAGQALSLVKWWVQDKAESPTDYEEHIASACYSIADAMLKAREES